MTAIRTEGVGVFLGSGGGSFGAVTKYAAPLTSTSLFLNSAEIRDVNGDGHRDVISQDARGNVALVWLGDGDAARGGRLGGARQTHPRGGEAGGTPGWPARARR
ncbi:FG-GAP repeat domain-containing protein, partial [Streptomyces vinaceus]|uniref:FG-GAP repeat domain-containing protein n=1 Tax=Streptomyces vinaceus TaxID=1960 RepID=UPI00369DF16D